MATVLCGDCGRTVSTTAVSCPGCGRPIAGRKPGETTGRDAVLVLLSLPVGMILGGLANYLTGGNVAAVALAFFGPIVAALVMASRRR